ncbi:hypothetical protein ACFW2V_41710 [Streptomyces sp. NPDC058947]|uniref:hypothetical protein n=1 Tax=Streptomyces TaxID=1883 RepID=UPI0036CBAB95
MRYKVVPVRQGLEMLGWGIWDDEVSPKLHDAGVRPALCSLDGEKELFFRFMTGAYSWLGHCEAQGLDLQAGPVRMDVYSDGDERGGVLVQHEAAGTGGPAIRSYPLG